MLNRDIAVVLKTAGFMGVLGAVKSAEDGVDRCRRWSKVLFDEEELNMLVIIL